MNRLVSMGFDRAAVEAMLLSTEGDTELAVERILSTTTTTTTTAATVSPQLDEDGKVEKGEQQPQSP